MSKIVFIEGVSGVGKTTMVRALSDALIANGRRVQSYIEFDFTNPIDFYCTAYFPNDTYERLCTQYKDQIASIRQYTIPAGDAMLVRYYNEDTPLFGEPLLSDIRAAEFCYHPKNLISRTRYTAAYRAVWQNFIADLDPDVDVYLFDGSLLHHPINDMMRNYHVTAAEAGEHVAVLLDTLQGVDWSVQYLYTDDIAAQLTLAHRNRGQRPPTEEDIAFWLQRRKNDQAVLEHTVKQYRVYCVSAIGWDHAREQILQSL